MFILFLLLFRFLVVEICAGNLEDFISGKYKGPSLGSVKTMCHQIVKGLDHLHLLGITHQDLKPTNILISYPKGGLHPKLKLTDFGLCHAFRNKFSRDEKEMLFRPAFTKGLMCPSDEVDEEGHRKSSFDIFPLGLVFGFTASRGIHPFGSIARIKNKMSMTLTLVQMDESVRSDAFMELLYRMLDFDASKRPNASEILHHQIFQKRPVIESQNVSSLLLPSASTLRQPNGEAPVKRMQSMDEGNRLIGSTRIDFHSGDEFDAPVQHDVDDLSENK